MSILRIGNLICKRKRVVTFEFRHCEFRRISLSVRYLKVNPKSYVETVRNLIRCEDRNVAGNVKGRDRLLMSSATSQRRFLFSQISKRTRSALKASNAHDVHKMGNGEIFFKMIGSIWHRIKLTILSRIISSTYLVYLVYFGSIRGNRFPICAIRAVTARTMHWLPMVCRPGHTNTSRRVLARSLNILCTALEGVILSSAIVIYFKAEGRRGRLAPSHGINFDETGAFAIANESLQKVICINQKLLWPFDVYIQRVPSRHLNILPF